MCIGCRGAAGRQRWAQATPADRRASCRGPSYPGGPSNPDVWCRRECYRLVRWLRPRRAPGRPCRPDSASRPRALEDELGEEPDADSSRALEPVRRIALRIGRAADVALDPGVALPEFLQEPAAGDR